MMGMVPPSIIRPEQPGIHAWNVALLETASKPTAMVGYVILDKKRPLRKCLQCFQLKREDFKGQRCAACYEENEQFIQIQLQAGELIPLDRNLSYQPYNTTIPDVHECIWYFLKWLLSRGRAYRKRQDGPHYEAMLLNAGYEAELRCEVQ